MHFQVWNCADTCSQIWISVKMMNSNSSCTYCVQKNSSNIERERFFVNFSKEWIIILASKDLSSNVLVLPPPMGCLSVWVIIYRIINWHFKWHFKCQFYSYITLMVNCNSVESVCKVYQNTDLCYGRVEIAKVKIKFESNFNFDLILWC